MGFRNWYDSADTNAVKSSFSEQLFAARDDIRHKLVEEAWYGQQTTGNTVLRDTAQHVAGHIAVEGTLGHDPDLNFEPGSVWDNEHDGTIWENENDPAIQPLDMEPE